MNRKNWKLALSVLGISALAGAAASFGISATVGSVSQRQEALSTLHVLGVDQTSADKIPSTEAVRLLGEGGLIGATSRLLGTDSAGSYWVAIDQQNNVCVVAILVDDKKSSSACAEPKQFLQRGVSIGVGVARSLTVDAADAVWSEAYVVPDGKKVAGLVPGLNQIGPNLVTGDSRATSESAKVSQSAKAGVSGDTFTLFLLDQAEEPN